MSDGILAYSIEHAAKLSGLGRTRLYQEISDGRLEARKAGKRTLRSAPSANTERG
jgi:hypothetical protein